MACMSSNAESPKRDLGDRLKMTNCILDSGATCRMTPEIFYFIPDRWLKQINVSKVQVVI